MKFPRNARLLRSPFDVAPYVAVFFLLIIFLMLATLLPAPGLSLRLPIGEDLPGTDKPTVAAAIDAGGRLFFANQIVSENELKSHLRAAAKESREPLTLVIRADKAVTYEQLVRVTLLARDAGVRDVLLATLPHVVSAPNQP
jgi:biopolymer transport protein ExbD